MVADGRGARNEIETGESGDRGRANRALYACNNVLEEGSTVACAGDADGVLGRE